MAGWIKIQREIIEHWIWQDSEKLKWWLDLIIQANYIEGKINIKWRVIDCNRGEIVTTLTLLAKRWGVGKDRVRNFLILLKKDNMIQLESQTKFTRITICNYDSYQSMPNDTQTIPKRYPNDTQTIPKRSIYLKEDKERKEFKEEEREGETPQLPSPAIAEEAPESKKNNEKLPAKEIKELWNATCAGFPKLHVLSENRKNKIRVRIEEMGGVEKALPLIKQIFEKAQASKFLKGDNKKGWKASFDWIFENDKNWVKVWEGNYDDNKGNNAKNGSNLSVNDIWK